MTGQIGGKYYCTIDNNGNTVIEYRYDAWGKILSQGTSNILAVNPFRYRGYYYDTETELYYLQTRYYDPETGRFLSAGSMRYLAPKIINGLNLYAYCLNNPICYIDRTGTSLETSTGVNLWPLYNFKNYIWRSGRYQPRRVFKIGKNPFEYFVNNLLYTGEFILSKFELNFGGYEFTFLNFNGGVTLLSAGFGLLNGRVYFSNTDYLGVKLGSLNLDIIDIQPTENDFTFLDAEATALAVGAYLEYVDAELLVGSVGIILKFKEGKFTFGLSWGIGFKITIKLW